MTNNMNSAFSRRVLSAGLLCLLAGFSARQASALDDNLQITGTLVSEPCTLDVSSDLLVNFGSVITPQLYRDSRTEGVPFKVSLLDCDTAIGEQVNLTFSGDESSVLPGKLAASGDGGTGIAIGLETLDGAAVQLNQLTPTFALQDGTTAISLQAYVQAEPEAIAQHSLVPGSFSANATISASYP